MATVIETLSRMNGNFVLLGEDGSMFPIRFNAGVAKSATTIRVQCPDGKVRDVVFHLQQVDADPVDPNWDTRITMEVVPVQPKPGPRYTRPGAPTPYDSGDPQALLSAGRRQWVKEETGAVAPVRIPTATPVPRAYDAEDEMPERLKRQGGVPDPNKAATQTLQDLPGTDLVMADDAPTPRTLVKQVQAAEAEVAPAQPSAMTQALANMPGQELPVVTGKDAPEPPVMQRETVESGKTVESKGKTADQKGKQK